VGGTSTMNGLASAISPLAVWLRRVALILLAVVVGAGATGFLGVRTAEVSATRRGYDLNLEYPVIARAGLDIVWSLTVHHPGGFGGQLTVRVSRDYGDILETQGYSPQPSSETQDGRYAYLGFDPPPGDTFTLDLDAYVQPSSQVGRAAEVAVLDRGGQPLVSVSFHTRLVP